MSGTNPAFAVPRNMTPGQARVIDPILSQHARGYTNATFIGQLLLPYADIPQRGGRVIRFGKEAFRKYNTRRAPGAETQRVSFGYASDPIALFQDSLEGLVPAETAEEAANVPGIDLGRLAVEQVQDIIALGRECEIADLVRDAATYGGNVEAVAGADKWTDPASNPKQQVDDAAETIRRKIGRRPNVLTLSPSAKRAACDHPRVREQFKYTSADSITVEMLARYFQVDTVLIGDAVVLDDDSDDDAEARDVWGDDAILSYRPAGSNYMVPAFGYTYRLRGSPVVEQPYHERNRKSWVYPVTEDWQPVVAGAEGGFLLQGVGG